MTATQKVSLSRKRPAGTPPSTFLFLPIHLSNSPEPSGPVFRLTSFPRALNPGWGARTREKPPKPAHPTWPLAGRMIHRANSEGLLKARHRIKRRRAKRGYIGFGCRHCQRLRAQNASENVSRIERPDNSGDRICGIGFRRYSPAPRRTTATFLRRPLPNGVGSVASWGRDDVN